MRKNQIFLASYSVISKHTNTNIKFELFPFLNLMTLFSVVNLKYFPET